MMSALAEPKLAFVFLRRNQEGVSMLHPGLRLKTAVLKPKNAATGSRRLHGMSGPLVEYLNSRHVASSGLVM